MKILAITLKNLNSLRGEWNINLEDSVYTSSGIFAVTGPTGAGKTTIFDAVCLALYKRTPRLSKVSANDNEIMSKHTDNCMAEVKFETNGKIYVCNWTQKRTGRTIQTSHTITIDGITLNDSHKSASEIVKDITRMDFDRFVQSVLLEQGGFDSFLKAGKNERAEVLELITGTGIYSKISERVFYRNKEEQKALTDKQDDIAAEKSRYAGMTEESLWSEISRKESEITRAESQHKSTEKLLSWYKEIMSLKNDMAGIMEELRLHIEREKSFEAKRVILDLAERARSLAGEYSTLIAKRKAKDDAGKEISGLSAKISSQESECARISGTLPGLIDEVSRLKGNITESPEAVLARIESAVSNYDAQRKARDDADKALSDAKRELEKAQEVSARAMAEGKAARARMNDANDNYSRIFEQIMSMRAKTASAVLDQERAKLKDGMPCPLCGSLTHPLTAHNDSGCENPDDLFRQTELLEAELKRAKSAADSAQKFFDSAVTNWNEASANLSAAEQKHKQCSENSPAMRVKLNECHKALTDAIRRAGISFDNDTHRIITHARQWSARIKALEDRIQSLQQKIGEIKAVIVSDNKSLAVKCKEFQAIAEELDGLEGTFSEKLRGENFDGEESLRRSLSHSGEIETLRAEQQKLAQESAMLNGKLAGIRNQLDAKQSMNLTHESFEAIEARNSQEEERLNTLHQEKGILTQKLQDVKDSAEKVKALQNEYDKMKAEAEDWKMLCSLIGSAKGDKFRIYAQKVTLALVVNNANDYLKKMNGRYTLILTPESEELELSVKDSEQAGIIRPTSNLSGGEKFIISLALALGLSQISGSRAQVDSLFIDEGFGSLDEDSLNAALDALGEIKRDGRMIGIISHISGISERIPARISVIPKSEGTSIITGPGCSGSSRV